MPNYRLRTTFVRRDFRVSAQSGRLAVLLVVAVASAFCADRCPAADAKNGKPIDLFNGRDLTGWRADLADKTVKMEDVWSVKDGILTCRGVPKGSIRTDEEYENYELVVEWRWPKDGKPGNNGVLVHTSTPNALGVWPKSLEVQLAHENAGDFWVIGTTIEIPDGDKRIQGRRHLNLTDGSEKPIGDWNRMEIVCRGHEVVVKVNGDLVNHATNCSESRGAISLQSEGAVIQFRKVTLTPLEK